MKTMCGSSWQTAPGDPQNVSTGQPEDAVKAYRHDMIVRQTTTSAAIQKVMTGFGPMRRSTLPPIQAMAAAEINPMIPKTPTCVISQFRTSTA